MTTGYSVPLRAAQLNQISTTVGSAGILTIYAGVQPATGGTATTVLATFTLGTPYAAATATATLSPTLPANVNASATGTATWFRVASSTAVQCIDGTVGTTGADMILNTTSLTSGNPVAVTAWTVTRGNP